MVKTVKQVTKNYKLPIALPIDTFVYYQYLSSSKELFNLTFEYMNNKRKAQ